MGQKCKTVIYTLYVYIILFFNHLILHFQVEWGGKVHWLIISTNETLIVISILSFKNIRTYIYSMLQIYFILKQVKEPCVGFHQHEYI